MAMLPADIQEGGGGGEPDFEVGFRFRPTEIELIDFYLRRRTQGDLTIPKSFIQELDIYKSQPWHLPYHLFPYCYAEEKEMYFFTRRRRARNNNSKRFSRSVDEGGLWDGHAAGMSLYKIEQARNNKEKIKIGHRVQLAFKLFDDPNDKKNKKSTLWILHEYRFVDDNADDVVLCRIHKRKDKDKDEEEEEVVEEERMAPVINTQHRVDEQVSLLPAVQPLMEVNAVAAADVDDDDLSLVQLLEEELTEVEVEQRRVKRQRIGGGQEENHHISMNQQQLQSPTEKRCAKRQRIEQEEEGEAHQASAVDTDDGLTMTLDEINNILDELPSNTSQQQSVDSMDVEQILKCLEVDPLTSFDDLSFCLDSDILQETLSPAVEERRVKGEEEIMSAMQDRLNPPLPAYAVDEYCYDLQALGICEDLVF